MPTKDPYFKKPEFLKRWHESLLENRWLRGGILGLILIALAAGLVTMALRLLEPPPLSKYLPANTLAYTEWAVGPLRGEATLTLSDTPQLYFYELKDRTAAEQKHAGHPEWPPLASMGRYVVVADSTDALALLDQVKNGAVPSLHQDEKFLKLRPNLDYTPSWFKYRSTAGTVTPLDTRWLDSVLLARHDWLDAPLTQWFAQVFTATGQTDDGRAYTVGDKSFMDGNPLFHLEKKYKGRQLELLPSTVVTLYAGTDLASLTQQLTQLLNQSDGIAGSILNGLIANRFHQIFPESIEAMATLNTLFSDEATWATTEDGGQILLLELSEEGTHAVEMLTDTLLTSGLNEINPTTGALRNLPLQMQRVESGTTMYDQFKKPNGELFIAKAIEGDTLILTTTAEAMKAVLETITGSDPAYTETKMYEGIKSLIENADQVRVQPGQVLTFNLFDDGIITQQLFFGP